MDLTYVTKTARTFSDSAANATMALTDCDEMDPNEAPNRPDKPWSVPDEPEPTYGTLTVTGLSEVFIEVYVVAETITPGNFAVVMEKYLAIGKGPDGYPAELYWHFGEGSGTYNVLISSSAGDVKFQNRVAFANGSGSINWGSMTEIDMAPLNVGTLSFTGGTPGKDWTVLIAPGPITTAEEGWNAWNAFTAAATEKYPSISGSSWMVLTGDYWALFDLGGFVGAKGAKGGDFNRNGIYTIIYIGDKGIEYQNTVSFTNGNTTINLASLSNFSTLPGYGE
jgi:hypothetical protein